MDAALEESDEALVDRFLGGDREAFGRLAGRHVDRLYRYVSWSVNGADADDVTQDVLLAAYESLASWRRRSSFRTWLYGVARNVCRRHRRDLGRRRPLIDGLSDPDAAPDWRPGPLEAAVGAEHNEALLAAIARLSPEHRLTLMLRAWEGMSYAEIAAATGVPRGTVRSRLHHARAAVAAALEGKP